MVQSSLLSSSYVPITLGIAYILSYVVLFFFMIKRARQNFAIKRAFTGLGSIQLNPNLESISQSERAIGLYHFLSRKYGSQFTGKFSSPIEMVTDIVYLLETHYRKTDDDDSATTKNKKSKSGSLEVSLLKSFRPGPTINETINQIKDRKSFLSFCVNLAAEMRQKDPYAGITGRHATLLKGVSDAITNANTELAENSLDQLSKEIENLQSTVRYEQRRNTTSTIISVVGISLTLVFGGISLLQYFNATKSTTQLNTDSPQQGNDPLRSISEIEGDVNDDGLVEN